MERAGKGLRPWLVRMAKVLLLPLRALRDLDPKRFSESPGKELHPDVVDFLYPAMLSDQPLFCDTGLPLGRSRKKPISAQDIGCFGELRRRAVDRAKVLLRILELGLLEELRAHSEADVLVDGPIAPMFKYYSSIVSSHMARMRDLGSDEGARESFRFLSRVTGAVKNVVIIPRAGLAELTHGSNLRIPVFRFSDVIQDTEEDAADDDVYGAVLCCFVQLRPELPGLWSPLAGVTRLDVPLPAVLDTTSREVAGWLREALAGGIAGRLDESAIGRLRELLHGYVHLAWPLPAASGVRNYTELYPIAETERWLRSQLLHPYELLTQLGGGP